MSSVLRLHSKANESFSTEILIRNAVNGNQFHHEDSDDTGSGAEDRNDNCDVEDDDVNECDYI